MIVEGLFKLDTDNDVWQNLGFDDFDSEEVPRWLSDERVREGIRVQLELDRCEEELRRLSWERCALQEWFMAEWRTVQKAKEAAGKSSLYQKYGTLTSTVLAGNSDMQYQVNIHMNMLLDLCIRWRPRLNAIDASGKD